MGIVTDGSGISSGVYNWDIDNNPNLYLYACGDFTIKPQLSEWTWNTDEVVLFLHYRMRCTIKFEGTVAKPGNISFGTTITIDPKNPPDADGNVNRMDVLVFQRMHGILYLKNHLKDMCASW